MRRVREARRVGRTVVLRLRFHDYARATRSHTLGRPTARTQTVLDVARSLLAATQPLIEERGLTLIGVALTNLADDRPLQLELPLAGAETTTLDATLDEIKQRFGSSAVTRAVLLHRTPDLAIPLLSD